MFLLEEDLADVITLKCLLRDLLIMRDEVLILIVAKILHIFQDDSVGLVVNPREKALEALSALQLDVYFVGKKIFYSRYAHLIKYTCKKSILLHQVSQHLHLLLAV